MSQLWSPALHTLTPYVPGEQPRERLVKLNTNENPYPPAPGVHDCLQQFPQETLRLYPDPASSRLKEQLARTYNVPAEHIFVGNGSDEVLAIAFMAFFRQSAPLLMPEISYSFYPVYANLFDIDTTTLPLNDDWQVDLGAFDQPNGGIVFANPNATTGHAHPRQAIATLLDRQRDSVILVDEAYVDFGGESCVSLTEFYDNILVVGTFSKSRSLAGLRLGFAIGSPELIEGMERVKNAFNSYPVDRLTEAVGIKALEDEDYFQQTTQAIVETREWSIDAMRERQMDVLPSSANFVLARPTTRPAKEVFAELRKHGIVVRYFDTPLLKDWLRISIGTNNEMQQMFLALDGILPN